MILLIILFAGVILEAHDWLGRDKAAHFTTSVFLTCYSYGICRDSFGNTDSSSRLCSAGISISLGLGKEYYDRGKPQGRWSWEDLAWDAAGICCGLVLINNNIMK